jgi:hypothetical protein
MFVRWSCGCVGLRITDPDAGSDPDSGPLDFVIKACDGEDRAVGIWQRDQSDKTYQPLSGAQIVDLTREMDGFMGKGHRYDAIRAMLGIP